MSTPRASTTSSAWTGWAAFAGVIILISAIFSLLQGLALLLLLTAYDS